MIGPGERTQFFHIINWKEDKWQYKAQPAVLQPTGTCSTDLAGLWVMAFTL